MHPSSQVRRVHSVQLKAAVLAACNEPGASIAAVALAHGLNANLVRKWRKWRMGRGLVRSGLVPSAHQAATAAPSQLPSAPSSPLLVANARLLPIELAAPLAVPVVPPSPSAAAQPEPAVHIELKRGLLSLTVRWPASGAGECTAWLRELSAGVLK